MTAHRQDNWFSIYQSWANMYVNAWQTAFTNWHTIYAVSPSPTQQKPQQQPQKTFVDIPQAQPPATPIYPSDKTPISTKKTSPTRQRASHPQTSAARSSRTSATAASAARRSPVHRSITRTVSR